jgi:SH3 domain-containing protein
MGPARFAASFALLLLAGAALADTGDALLVTGNGVNVRAGPSADAAIRMRVDRGQQVIELQREGSWVRAEIAGTGGQEGWIHSSLLAEPAEEPDQAETAPPAPADDPRIATPPPEPAPPSPEQPAAAQEQNVPLQIEPAAGPDRDVGELARFRETVSYLNERAMAIGGTDLFAEVKPGPEGAMQVVATDAWSSLPPAGRQSYANTLLDRWAAAKVSAGPAILQIVDPSGEVVMEKTEP